MPALRDPLGIIGTSISAKYDVTALLHHGHRSVISRTTHRIWQQPVALQCFQARALPPARRASWLESFERA
jgi:hypothetical protein